MTRKEIIQTNINFTSDLSNFNYHRLRISKSILNKVLIEMFSSDEIYLIQKEIFKKLNTIGLATKDKRYYTKVELIKYIEIYYHTLIEFAE